MAQRGVIVFHGNGKTPSPGPGKSITPPRGHVTSRWHGVCGKTQKGNFDELHKQVM